MSLNCFEYERFSLQVGDPCLSDLETLLTELQAADRALLHPPVVIWVSPSWHFQMLLQQMLHTTESISRCSCKSCVHKSLLRHFKLCALKNCHEIFTWDFVCVCLCECISNVWLHQRHTNKQTLLPTLCMNFSPQVHQNKYDDEKCVFFFLFFLSLSPRACKNVTCCLLWRVVSLCRNSSCGSGTFMKTKIRHHRNNKQIQVWKKKQNAAKPFLKGVWLHPIFNHGPPHLWCFTSELGLNLKTALTALCVNLHPSSTSSSSNTVMERLGSEAVRQNNRRPDFKQLPCVFSVSGEFNTDHRLSWPALVVSCCPCRPGHTFICLVQEALNVRQANS